MGGNSSKTRNENETEFGPFEALTSGNMQWDLREYCFNQTHLKSGHVYPRRFVVHSHYYHQHSLLSSPSSSSSSSSSTSSSSSSSDEQLYPTLLLFHGTRQTAYTSTLFVQYLDDDARAWQALARRHRVLLVFMESQRGTTGCWQPGKVDLEYVARVLDELPRHYRVDPARTYALGHSNGGLFLADFAPTPLGARFAALCNHMGGLEPPLVGMEEAEGAGAVPGRQIDEIPSEMQPRVPMMVLTSPPEDNYAPSLTAFRTFSAAGWPVLLYEHLDPCQVHGFHPVSAETVWEFFQQSGRIVAQAAQKQAGIAAFRAFDWKTHLAAENRDQVITDPECWKAPHVSTILPS